MSRLNKLRKTMTVATAMVNEQVARRLPLTDPRDFEAARRGLLAVPPAGGVDGPEGDAVTDTKLRVQGIEGLRVADCSIMPQLVSGNTCAPTMMIADRAADFVLEDA